MDVMAEVGACCVAEVMGTELYTLTPDTVVASARRLAFDNGIDHLLVLENGTLAGIVCKDDLRFAARTRSRQRVHELARVVHRRPTRRCAKRRRSWWSRTSPACPW